MPISGQKIVEGSALRQIAEYPLATTINRVTETVYQVNDKLLIIKELADESDSDEWIGEFEVTFEPDDFKPFYSSHDFYIALLYKSWGNAACLLTPKDVKHFLDLDSENEETQTLTVKSAICSGLFEVKSSKLGNGFSKTIVNNIFPRNLLGNETLELVDAIQAIKKELPTIAGFNVKNPPRIHIVWWSSGTHVQEYAEKVQSKKSSFLHITTFLEEDDLIQEGDWILSWKCNQQGTPNQRSKVSWMHVDEVIPKGYNDGSEYTKLVVQTKRNDLFPFILDEKVGRIIKQLLQHDDFREEFFRWNGWHSPAQEFVRTFLNRVQKEYNNA